MAAIDATVAVYAVSFALVLSQTNRQHTEAGVVALNAAAWSIQECVPRRRQVTPVDPVIRVGASSPPATRLNALGSGSPNIVYAHSISGAGADAGACGVALVDAVVEIAVNGMWRMRAARRMCAARATWVVAHSMH